MTRDDAPLIPLENTSRSVTLEGRELLLIDCNGELHLYENLCPHARETLDPMGGNLSDDSGQLVHCQRHGAMFLATSGECVAGPCMGEFLTAVAFTKVGDSIYLD